ncbi:MAG: GNAT family N-acetyltransferase [Fimbriiglobus sp.]
MEPVIIQAGRLELVLQTPEEVLAWVESLPPEVRGEVSPDWIARVLATLPGDVWSLSFAARLREGVPVGVVAFKGPPDNSGTVEIAYGIDEEHQRQGYATEAATALVAYALANRRVFRVRAHTKADNPASIRVLERCGFAPLGEVMDPEDGLVLRWEVSKPMIL